MLLLLSTVDDADYSHCCCYFTATLAIIHADISEFCAVVADVVDLIFCWQFAVSVFFCCCQLSQILFCNLLLCNSVSNIPEINSKKLSVCSVLLNTTHTNT